MPLPSARHRGAEERASTQIMHIGVTATRASPHSVQPIGEAVTVDPHETVSDTPEWRVRTIYAWRLLGGLGWPVRLSSHSCCSGRSS